MTNVEADRTCVAILDACENFKTSHIEKVLLNQELLQELKYFYTTGFMLEIKAESCFKMAEYALVHNISFCYNFASEDCTLKDDELFKMIEFSDYVFCSKQEAIAFSKKYGT